MRDIQINHKKIPSLFDAAYNVAQLLHCSIGEALKRILSSKLVREALSK